MSDMAQSYLVGPHAARATCARIEGPIALRASRDSLVHAQQLQFLTGHAALAFSDLAIRDFCVALSVFLRGGVSSLQVLT
jgi:hypothetical protein